MQAEFFWRVVLSSCLAYVLGSFSPSILVARALKSIDIREHGSGNAGLTNTLRVLGKKSAIIVTLLDVLKAAIAMFIGRALLGEWGIISAGVGVLMGHVFPVFHHFKGGKGVLVSAVVLGFVDWRVLLTVLLTFIAFVLLSGRVSLGSICGATMAPVSVAIFLPGDDRFLLFALVLASFIIFLHRGNIKRLAEGTEPKIVAADANEKLLKKKKKRQTGKGRIGQ